MSKLEFRETQKFRQPWVWCLVLGSAAVMLWIFGHGLVQQLVVGKPWGDQPMSDMGLVLTSLVTTVVSLGLVWLFLAMALVVEVRSDALHIHFKPLKRRTVAYSDIAKVEAVRYRPVVHYGGWGIRRGRKGGAYNVSGNQGVRLDFHDGTHLLIGSQRFVELAAAIEKERGR
jgi:hypothetical protein